MRESARPTGIRHMRFDNLTQKGVLILATVTIDPTYCKACGLCILACKKGVLKYGTKVNALGYHPVVPDESATCIGCKLCAVMCPDAAIEVYE